MIDTKAIEEHIRGILKALGDDPDREGLKDTPKRVAKCIRKSLPAWNIRITSWQKNIRSSLLMM